MPGTLGPVAPWIWAVLALIGLGIAAAVAFGVTFGLVRSAVAAALPGAGAAMDLRLDLAVFLIVAAVLGIGAVLAAARLAFGAWVAFRTGALLVPVAGLVLAVAVELVLHEWARTRLGSYDWDFIGPTALLSLSLVMTGIAAFAVVTAPSQAVVPPLVGVAACTAVVVGIAAANVGGLRDGVAAESVPLAGLVGLSAGYAVGAFGISIASVARRARRGRYRRG